MIYWGKVIPKRNKITHNLNQRILLLSTVLGWVLLMLIKNNNINPYRQDNMDISNNQKNYKHDRE